jgi:hypothetical protein
MGCESSLGIQKSVMERWIELLGNLRARGLRIARRRIVLCISKTALSAPPSVE